MDLLSLQGNIKRDPDGYLDEFRQQYRHYKACLDIFKLTPTKESREFAELVGFVSQVASCYPKEVAGFADELGSLLEEQAASLDPGLRQSLARALILMRNRGALSALELMPTLFRLFRVQDKALRQLVFRHIIADIKASNRKHQDNKTNRGVQAFLYRLLQGEEESAALRALAVLTELHRRNVWRDARTVNVIASATQHPSSRVMLASLKFFLGQDEAEDAESSDDEDGVSRPGAELGSGPQAPSRKDIYAAKAKGTNSSKKKKAAKLKRVMHAVKKHERRASGYVSESFAAMQLLHDPQTFAERLFARLQKANERLETRLAMMAVISRAIGVHKLLVLSFYPFLQKYIQPHQQDVTRILAFLIQAVHDVVPPDALAPVLKQLADSFVNDRTRPEVMTVGIKTVRELAARAPLIMTPELLQDLAEYRKYKNKEVSAAARSLIGLFRQLNPGLLAKKDRGKGADLESRPHEYGATRIPDRIEGAELLQAAELRGDDSDASSDSGFDVDSDTEEADLGAGTDAEDAGRSDGEADQDDQEAAEATGSDVEVASDDEESEEAGGSDDEAASLASDGEGAIGSDGEEAALSSDDQGSDDEDGEEERGAEEGGRKQQQEGRGAKRKRQQPSQPESLSSLKKRLTKAQAANAAPAAEEAADGGEGDSSVPIEWGRILSQEDFERIKELRHKKLVNDMMVRAGLKKRQLNERQLARLREEAEAEAEEALEAEEASRTASERRVRDGQLEAKRTERRTKEERMQSVLEGREGREFGAATARKKNKTGGLSNRQQQKKKRLPGAARAQQLKRRAAGKPTGKAAAKAHRGKSAYHTGGGKPKKRRS